MSNERATVNDSDLLASSLAGSRTSRRTFLKSLASAGLLLYVAPSTLPKPAWAAPANAKIVLRWNDAMLAAIPVAGLPGPAPNRALAIVHTAIYDAWTPYTERATPTQPGPSRRPKSERTLRNKSEAISYAAYRTLLDLFPTRTHKSFEDLMVSLGYNPGDTSTGETSPVSPSEIGNRAAQRVLKARRDDGSNQQNNYADTTGYLPADPPDPNHWQPLCLPLDTLGCTPQKFVTPHWGQVRPFGLSSGSELRNEVAGMLKAYPDQHYIEQHSEVLKLSAELDDRTKTIAEYWADGPGSVTPPGHWNVIAQYVSRRDSHDLDSDVKLYFVLNNATDGLLHRRLGCETLLRLDPPHQRDPLPLRGQAGANVGRPHDRRREVAHLHPGHTAACRVRLGTQRRQQRGGGAAQGFHRQQLLRCFLEAVSGRLANRAGRHAEQTGDALMGDLYGSRRRGGDVAALGRHPHL